MSERERGGWRERENIHEKLYSDLAKSMLKHEYIMKFEGLVLYVGMSMCHSV